MLDRPSEARAGQWWGWATEGGWYENPERLTEVTAGLVNQGPRSEYFEKTSVYLGDGEHPEPSGWLLETCARHVLEVYGSGPMRECIAIAEGALLRGDRGTLAARAAASLAGILRSMGRW